MDITLTGAGELTGVVREAGTGSPIRHATVTVTDRRGEVNDTCTTTQDGRYALTCLGTGNYTLVANRSGYQPVALSLSIRGNGPHTHDVDLVKAQSPSPTPRRVDWFASDLTEFEQSRPGKVNGQRPGP